LKYLNFEGFIHNWGCFVGFSALMGYISLPVCLPLYLGCAAWTVVQDTMYTHQDKEDDIRTGVKSLALLWQDKTNIYLTISSLIFG
jgi:4-hydroxybenzoate polyprenyltransferase